MSSERQGGLRATIAAEAARLMYEEGVKQYFTAKRLAAKRVLGRVEGRRLRYRPRDLPSNGEIREALLAVAELAEGPHRERRLFAMRVLALEAMRALASFEPRLIGSVATGHIRHGSDVDLHVFTDDPDRLFTHLRALRWVFETERVSILKGGAVREYLHVHVADVAPIELTVYEPRELRNRPRSSTDGKPIERVSIAALEARMAREHPGPWARYQADGIVVGLDEIETMDEDPPGLFDGLLETDDAALLLEGATEDEPVEPYDPLPGFEDA